MSISLLWNYNSKRALSINNVEGENLRAPRGLAMEEGCPLSPGLSAALPASLSSARSLGLSFWMAALKKKIYSVIKHRAITLQVQNSHRVERGVLQTPTETIWSLHSKWHLWLPACLLPCPAFCLIQRNTVFEHRPPRPWAKSPGSGGSVPLFLENFNLWHLFCVDCFCLQGPLRALLTLPEWTV